MPTSRSVVLIIPMMVLLNIFYTGSAQAASTCKEIPLDSLSFCSKVDYSAVLEDQNDASSQDTDAALAYTWFEKRLGQFDCTLPYSAHTCEDCRLAYKSWLCSVSFPKCGGVGETNGTTCRTPDHVYGTDCTNANACCQSGRRKTCLDGCYQVIRTCPFIIDFQCPTGETRDYSPDSSTCHFYTNLRTVHV